MIFHLVASIAPITNSSQSSSSPGPPIALAAQPQSLTTTEMQAMPTTRSSGQTSTSKASTVHEDSIAHPHPTENASSSADRIASVYAHGLGVIIPLVLQALALSTSL